jgi:hypothetical protein
MFVAAEGEGVLVPPSGDNPNPKVQRKNCVDVLGLHKWKVRKASSERRNGVRLQSKHILRIFVPRIA